MADPIRDLWAVFFLLIVAAVITTVARSLRNEHSVLFKIVALFAAIATGITGFVAAGASLFAP